MASPSVSCLSCAREWHSATMAEGLRALNGCPRCGGELRFADLPRAGAPGPLASGGPDPASATLAPHLVLGVPRR